MSLHEWTLSVRGERRQPSFIRQLGSYMKKPGIVCFNSVLSILHKPFALNHTLY